MPKGTNQMGSSGTPGDPKDARIAALDDEVRTLKGEQDTLLLKLDVADRDKRSAIEEAKASEAKASNLEKNAAELGQKLEAVLAENDRLKGEVARIQSELAEAKAKQAAAEKACEAAEAERATLAARNEQLAKDLSSANDEFCKAITRTAEAEQEWKAAVQACEAAEKAKHDAEAALGRVNLRMEGKDREIKDLHEKVIKLLSRN